MVGLQVLGAICTALNVGTEAESEPVLWPTAMDRALVIGPVTKPVAPPDMQTEA